MSSNQYENKQFRKAARFAGVGGSKWNTDEAINDCSTEFHNKMSNRYERRAMTFDEMVDWARDWWNGNWHKYN